MFYLTCSEDYRESQVRRVEVYNLGGSGLVRSAGGVVICDFTKQNKCWMHSLGFNTFKYAVVISQRLHKKILDFFLFKIVTWNILITLITFTKTIKHTVSQCCKVWTVLGGLLCSELQITSYSVKHVISNIVFNNFIKIM